MAGVSFVLSLRFRDTQGPLVFTLLVGDLLRSKAKSPGDDRWRFGGMGGSQGRHYGPREILLCWTGNVLCEVGRPPGPLGYLSSTVGSTISLRCRGGDRRRSHRA